MELETIGTQSFAAIVTGAVLAVVIPIIVAVIWKVAKKERFTSILAGAATFLLFVFILEKPLQALVVSVDHPVSRFLTANPLLLAIVLGLFPGIFEETGRLVAYKTVLKNRRNRETAVSHGIGHGGCEVMILLGMSYITYISYAAMINSGTFATLIDQMPAQADTLYALAGQLAHLSFAGIIPGFAERLFAFLFHTGASIIVFYACKDRKKLWLYPLAIVLHTALDFWAGLYSLKMINIPIAAFEAILALFGILVFAGAYILLYRKDTDPEMKINHEKAH